MESFTALYAPPSNAALKLQYVGKHLKEVEPPAAVLDRAIVKRNCQAMLDVAEGLGVGFRAHIKSHKTVELSRLQVGENGPAKFIMSTVAEIEQMVPFLLDCQTRGRQASVLYGVPLPHSKIPRIINLARIFESETINVLIDHADAFRELVKQLETPSGSLTSRKLGIFLKIDTGYHRAGVKAGASDFNALLPLLTDTKGVGARFVSFKGFYSHLGNSYGGSSADEALEGLIQEIEGSEVAAKIARDQFPETRFTISVGATPTATAAQNVMESESQITQRLKSVIAEVKKHSDIELHAGVYPLLDLQQVATRARPATGVSRPAFEPLSVSNIGIRILVEVVSLYSDRDRPEALIAAGSLALGRDPCKDYPGWGIVTPWPQTEDINTYDAQKEKTGWIVGKISQEHGILVWEGASHHMRALKGGQKLLLWPNHACIASAGFGWYLIVDSDLGKDTIVDVWVRWRGW